MFVCDGALVNGGQSVFSRTAHLPSGSFPTSRKPETCVGPLQDQRQIRPVLQTQRANWRFRHFAYRPDSEFRTSGDFPFPSTVPKDVSENRNAFCTNAGRGK